MVICFLPAGPLAPGFMPVFSMASAGSTLSVVPTAADQPGPSKPTLPEVNASIPGLALIPPKLVQKILRCEFVDMHELFPETWGLEETQDSCCRSTRLKWGLVTDIGRGWNA